MKKVYILMILIMLLVTILVINGTYAKYSSNAVGTVEQASGNWTIKVNTADIVTRKFSSSIYDTKFNL